MISSNYYKENSKLYQDKQQNKSYKSTMMSDCTLCKLIEKFEAPEALQIPNSYA